MAVGFLDRPLPRERARFRGAASKSRPNPPSQGLILNRPPTAIVGLPAVGSAVDEVLESIFVDEHDQHDANNHR